MLHVFVSHTMQVNVRVLDDNDNAPVFRFPSYPITISEAIASNTIFITVFASDADIDANAELTYSIVGGNTSGKINKINCALLVT